MTHHTDAERAEFEACAVAEVFPISRCFDDDSLYEYTVTQRKWEDWQAARQAPAAPVPQGWRDGVLAVANMLKKKADAFADAHGYDDMGGLSFGQGSHADAKLEHHSNLLELEEEVRAMLAAAQKPPEAAPINVWQQAVDNALVNAHLGVAGEVTAEEAEKMLNDLICWNIEVATDPLTNGGKVLVSADSISANKPPKAAPVQLPEHTTPEHSKPMFGAAPKVDPIAWYVTGCSTMLDEHDAKAEAKRCGGTAQAVPLYTEQQLRALLANHGIKVET